MSETELKEAADKALSKLTAMGHDYIFLGDEVGSLEVECEDSEEGERLKAIVREYIAHLQDKAQRAFEAGKQCQVNNVEGIDTFDDWEKKQQGAA